MIAADLEVPSASTTIDEHHVNMHKDTGWYFRALWIETFYKAQMSGMQALMRT